MPLCWELGTPHGGAAASKLPSLNKQGKEQMQHQGPAAALQGGCRQGKETKHGSFTA